MHLKKGHLSSYLPVLILNTLFNFQRSLASLALELQSKIRLSELLILELVGLRRLELLTPRLSSVCSNQLSYRPSGPRSFKTKQLVFIDLGMTLGLSVSII
jgi:hypothetical protein